MITIHHLNFILRKITLIVLVRLIKHSFKVESIVKTHKDNNSKSSQRMCWNKKQLKSILLPNIQGQTRPQLKEIFC